MEAASISETLITLNQASYTLEIEAVTFKRTLNIICFCLVVSFFHQTERMKKLDHSG
jgi:hypothetical protein